MSDLEDLFLPLPDDVLVNAAECLIRKMMQTKLLTWESAHPNMEIPTLMGSVGGCVFVLDVTRGERRKLH